MKTKQQEGWEERFDELGFPDVDSEPDGQGGYTASYERLINTLTKIQEYVIKAFIRQELTALHKADCERFRGMLEDEALDATLHEPDIAIQSRNELRAELRTALSKMEEEV